MRLRGAPSTARRGGDQCRDNRTCVQRRQHRERIGEHVGIRAPVSGREMSGARRGWGAGTASGAHRRVPARVPADHWRCRRSGSAVREQVARAATRFWLSSIASHAAAAFRRDTIRNGRRRANSIQSSSMSRDRAARSAALLRQLFAQHRKQRVVHHSSIDDSPCSPRAGNASRQLAATAAESSSPSLSLRGV